MNNNSYRYYTPQEVSVIIRAERYNHYDAWSALWNLPQADQDNIYSVDVQPLINLTDIINIERTKKLIRHYDKLRSTGKCVEYTVDLDAALVKLFGQPAYKLQHNFATRKDRDGYIVLRVIM
jgi:hypothetical protein